METDDQEHCASGQRARIVCYRCHKKKTRCDLQHKSGTCTACIAAGSVCEFRPSRKGHHLKRTAGRSRQPRHPTASDNPPEKLAIQGLSIASDNRNYVRALLGHQSELHGRSEDNSESILSHAQAHDGFAAGAMRSYLEIYSECCYCWCPIIDIDESATTTDSLILDHSVAAIARMVRPSIMPGLSSAREHYERARYLFHADRQHSGQGLVKAALLLAASNHDTLGSHTDGSFWWLGIAIRLAQDLRLHRAPRNETDLYNMGMRRRIWWTLFARERIVALCQGRPCIIDEDDCNLGLPDQADFPTNRSREAGNFAHLVSICRIMGDVNKHMARARRTASRIPTQQIARSLDAWLSSLSNDLQLHIEESHTAPFVRDVHLLHLPYLTTVSLMYLNATGQDISEASAAAVMAAACTTRIIGDILLRGLVHTLPEDACWFITVAITALLHVRTLTTLFKYAAADIRLLRSALEQLSNIWRSAKVLAAGVDKILDELEVLPNMSDEHHEGQASITTRQAAPLFTPSAQSVQDLSTEDGVLWEDFFPFVTVRTSPLVQAIITECQGSYLEFQPALDINEQFNEIWNELIAGQAEFWPVK